MTTPEDDELEAYPDGIFSKDAKVAGWLKATYILLPIWGLATLYVFWNGSHGWLDRGYWDQLQKAANTTYPFTNLNDPDVVQQVQENPETSGLKAD